jgi:catechol 2,3-dioxygenase-like lactoylglutathione lyase family enzyme
MKLEHIGIAVKDLAASNELFSNYLTHRHTSKKLLIQSML